MKPSHIDTPTKRESGKVQWNTYTQTHTLIIQYMADRAHTQTCKQLQSIARNYAENWKKAHTQ